MMNFMNPWSHIEIYPLRKNEQLQFFDTKIRIIYSLVGSVNIKRNDFETILGSDDFYLISRLTKYDISKTKGKVYCFSFEHFQKDTEQIDYLFQGDSVNKVKRTDFEVVQRLKQLLLLKVSPSSSSSSQIYKEYFSLVHTLEKYYASPIVFSETKHGKSRVEDIKQYIDHYFDQDLTLSSLAQRVYISEQYLSKIFKDEVGIGVSEYIIKRRLEKVRRLLTESELAITDIAFSAGFSNINSFNRLFKKYQGLTPSLYRQETKQNIVLKHNKNELMREDYKEIKNVIENELQELHHSTIEIDIRQFQPFHHDKLLINLGYAEDLLHRSYFKSIKPIGNYTNFKYGRVWGIIGQKLMPKIDGMFDFTKVDEVIQAILDLGLKPFLELGIKGKVVHGANRQVVKQTLLELPSQSFDELLERYQALLSHLINRYGRERAATWIFEVWKPNSIVLESTHQAELALFTTSEKEIDICCDTDYFVLFQAVQQLVKGVIPGAKVGGCGISMDIEGQEMQNFVTAWSKQKIQPDFLSIYVFPMDTVKDRALQHVDFYISPDSDFLIRSVQTVQSLLKHLKWQPELYISEFNVTISSRDIINDTSFKGPYILKNTLPIISEVDMLGYWQLSDFPSVSIDISEDEIFGGSGLVTKSGIPKPAFYAFEFLSLLGTDLLYQADGIVVTKKGSRLQLLSYHYAHLNSQYYYVDEKMFDKNNANEMFEQDGNLKLSVHIRGINEGRNYHLKRRLMGIDSGAILGEANQFSPFTHYRLEEIDYMKHRCIPKLNHQIILAEDGVLNLQIDLQPHEMVFFEIELY
ncbi:helix-turn-helix domain-containing protein [Streptococcus sp. ZJ93]|uniref:GH39 family glycosyl hydrolase n=1 Tax=Streptococcus handemini TaxID=3161188 RepID=UPI0032F00698